MNDANAKELIGIIENIIATRYSELSAECVKCIPAKVISVTGSMVTVRLGGSPDDGSQDFAVANRSEDTVSAGDSVWLNYFGSLTNSYITMNNTPNGNMFMKSNSYGATVSNNNVYVGATAPSSVSTSGWPVGALYVYVK